MLQRTLSRKWRKKTEQKKMFVNQASDKVFVPGIYKESLQLINKETNKPNRKLSRGSEQLFLQRRYTNGKEAHDKMPHITSHQGNANEDHNETQLHIHEDGYNQRHNTHASKDMENLEPLYLAGGHLKWCSCFGKHSLLVPGGVQHKVTI